MEFPRRIYITGAAGMLGGAVCSEFARSGEVRGSDLFPDDSRLECVDVTDFAVFEAAVRSFQPDLLINLAARTDLEDCERHPEAAWLTNALGADNAATIAQRFDIPLIQVSTAGIVQGTENAYNDFHQPSPLGVYAKSKYQSERLVQSLCHKHYIVRAGWMMGGGPAKDKKFINKLFRQIVAGATELKVVSDKFGTPTYTVPFALGLRLLCASGLYGTYNQVCEGECSRYEVALEFVRLLGLDTHIKVTPVTSEHFREEYFAPRPPSEKLVNMKLHARGFRHMPHWRDALREYSREFKAALPISFGDAASGRRTQKLRVQHISTP